MKFSEGKCRLVLQSETEIHRERRSIAPRKVFACPESFCTEHTFFYYIRNMSEKSMKFLESFWIAWKVLKLSWTFLNGLESLVLSGNFQYSLESIEGLESCGLVSFQTVWKLFRLSIDFPDCLYLSRLSGKFSNCQESFKLSVKFWDCL